MTESGAVTVAVCLQQRGAIDGDECVVEEMIFLEFNERHLDPCLDSCGVESGMWLAIGGRMTAAYSQ